MADNIGLDDRQRPRYGPPGRHPDNPHQEGRTESGTDNEEYIGSSEGDNAGHHSPGVTPSDSGNPAQTFDRPSANESEDHGLPDGEDYPTRTAHTPYYPSGGSGHRYPGVPVGEQVYCQGPLDPETGEGVIDINGRCTIGE